MATPKTRPSDSSHSPIMTLLSARSLLRGLPLGLLLVLAGCVRTETLPIAPIPLSDPVRIEVDGEPMVLHHPYLDEGELVGWERHSRSDSTLVRVPYEQEYTRLDETRSLLLGIPILVVALVLIAVV